MTKTEIEEWTIKEFWPMYKELCKTPFVTKWKGGARGEAITKMVQLNPSEELRQRIISSLQAQIIHRKKLYEFCGSAQRYENKIKYNKFYTNRDGKTWLHNKGWNDEIPSLMETQVEPRDTDKCGCGKEARHNRGKWYCDECFGRKMAEDSGMAQKLRESYSKLPKKRKDETHREWAERIGSQISGKYGSILK